jgi:hypothetical protein
VKDRRKDTKATLVMGMKGVNAGSKNGSVQWTVGKRNMRPRGGRMSVACL